MSERPITVRTLYQGNIDVVSSLSRQELASRLTDESQDKYSGFMFGKEPSAGLQLSQMNRFLDPEDSLKLKGAVADALGDINLEKVGSQGTAMLAFLAADIDARESIDPLIDLVENRIDPEDSDHGRVLSALTRFKDDPRVEAKFKEWFHQDKFWKAAGMIMNTLSSTSPEQYETFLVRYCEVSASHPDYFIENIVINALADKLKVHGITLEEVHAKYKKQKALALIRTMDKDELSELSSKVRENLV